MCSWPFPFHIPKPRGSWNHLANACSKQHYAAAGNTSSLILRRMKPSSIAQLLSGAYAQLAEVACSHTATFPSQCRAAHSPCRRSQQNRKRSHSSTKGPAESAGTNGWWSSYCTRCKAHRLPSRSRSQPQAGWLKHTPCPDWGNAPAEFSQSCPHARGIAGRVARRCLC